MLLAIPIFVGLEFFYYRRFAKTATPPRRYHREHERLEQELATAVKSRTELEDQLRQRAFGDEERVTSEVQPMLRREMRLRVSLRNIATLEANWLKERLHAIELKRRAVWRKLGSVSSVALQQQILIIRDEESTFEVQLTDLCEASCAVPNTDESQPFVSYVRQIVEFPFRYAREEPYAPRVSTLLSHWFIFIGAVVCVALAALIFTLGFAAYFLH